VVVRRVVVEGLFAFSEKSEEGVIYSLKRGYSLLQKRLLNLLPTQENFPADCPHRSYCHQVFEKQKKGSTRKKNNVFVTRATTKRPQ
jgi:hypothetical protein